MGEYAIASVSWGKDSVAMLWKLIWEEWPLDEVVFYDTGMEFDAIYAERDRTLHLLEANGIKYTELKPKVPFWWSMFVHPVRSRKTGEVHKHGYGWCGGTCRWGTTEKLRALDKYAEERNATVYVGIAADETRRLEKERKPYKRFPLVELGMTEADCLELCTKRCCHTWEQDGVPLYSILDRVSCWCCRNKNLKELRAIRDNLPDVWERLRSMEKVLGQMNKYRSLQELEEEAPC